KQFDTPMNRTVEVCRLIARVGQTACCNDRKDLRRDCRPPAIRLKMSRSKPLSWPGAFSALPGLSFASGRPTRLESFLKLPNVVLYPRVGISTDAGAQPSDGVLQVQPTLAEPDSAAPASRTWLVTRMV